MFYWLFKEINGYCCLPFNLSVNYMYGWKVADAGKNDEYHSPHGINSGSWQWEEDASSLSVFLCLLATFHK